MSVTAPSSEELAAVVAAVGLVLAPGPAFGRRHPDVAAERHWRMSARRWNAGRARPIRRLSSG